MKCPKCSTIALQQEQYLDVAVDRCPSCGGLWLDMMELERLLETRPDALLSSDRHFEKAQDTSGPRLNCPRCQGTYLVKLNSLLRPGTILDSCTVCYGLWLDAGELSRLADAGLAGWLRSLLGR